VLLFPIFDLSADISKPFGGFSFDLCIFLLLLGSDLPQPRLEDNQDPCLDGHPHNCHCTYHS
jgi:hypothetical protein